MSFLKNIMKAFLSCLFFLLSEPVIFAQELGVVVSRPQLHPTDSVRLAGITNNNPCDSILLRDSDGNFFFKKINDWQITGNSGIAPDNFLGTIDNKKLSIRTDNVERITVLGDGNIGVGTASPKALFHLTDAAGSGSMLFPYEIALIEKSGDLKFGLYNSTNEGSGETSGSAISFGFSNFFDSRGFHPGYEIQYARNDTSNYLRFNTLNRDANGFVTASPQANHMVLDDYGRVGINLGATGGAAPIMPTANLHVNGTVRFQNLPTGGGFYLTVDEFGNVKKSSNSVTARVSGQKNGSDTSDQIVKLNEEISKLKANMVLLQAQIAGLVKSKE